jgi:hypothetical protein
MSEGTAQVKVPAPAASPAKAKKTKAAAPKVKKPRVPATYPPVSEMITAAIKSHLQSGL